MTEPKPPEHLSPAARAWWSDVSRDYVLEPHHLRLLQLACEAWDRTQQAREILASEGLTTLTEAGGAKTHPAVAVERDSRTAFARLVRDLDLESETGPSLDRRFSGSRRRARNAERS